MEPAEILGIRWHKDKNEEEWLIRWKDHAECEVIWESFIMIQQQCVDLQLEDKELISQGSIVKPLVIHSYVRKGRKVNAGGQVRVVQKVVSYFVLECRLA